NSTPNLSGRFVLGAGAGVNLSPRSVGQFGGAETHTLTPAEVPPHAHPLVVKTVGYSSGWNDSHEAVGAPSQSKNNGNQTMNTANAGGGAPHNNMPPYYVLAYLMRVH
ncbi:MAG TPA: hypothetical protein VN673_08905, partial [Clostridia bacterium]|nr:hypothetical protein [Clostridia bacterium]